MAVTTTIEGEVTDQDGVCLVKLDPFFGDGWSFSVVTNKGPVMWKGKMRTGWSYSVIAMGVDSALIERARSFKKGDAVRAVLVDGWAVSLEKIE